MMGQFFFSAKIDNERTLFLAPLTERRKQNATEVIENTDDYFLYEKRGQGDDAEIEIIARVDSDEAALRLKDILNLD
ncbi:MAG: hypothetical protein JSR89_09185 [Proteobacteria bacterium]|nr:hypothetical protein [Pseudomonadota bacterium]